MTDYIADGFPRPKLTKCCGENPEWSTGYKYIPSCGDGPYFVCCNKCKTFYRSWNRARAYKGWNDLRKRQRAEKANAN